MTVLCLLLCLIGCGKKTSDSPAANDPGAASDGTESAFFGKYQNVDFSEMPAIDMQSVRLYPGNGTLLFEFTNPGMDSYESTIVHYSLAENKLLGRVDLGNGIFSVRRNSDGGFSVFDVNTAEGTYYSADCEIRKTVSLSCIEKGSASFIVQGDENEKLLVSDMRSGALYLVTPDGKTKTEIDLPAGAYEAIGSAGGIFVVSKDAQSDFVILQNGSAQEIFSKGAMQAVNANYAAGRVVDHLAFLPLAEGDPLFAKVHDTEEVMRAAGKGVFLTVTQKANDAVLRLYRMAKLKSAAVTVNGTVEAAGVVSDGQVAAVLKTDGGFAYQLLDPDTWKEEDLLSENDLSAVLGVVSLPAIGSKDETDAYTKEVLEHYGVRFLYEECDLTDQISEIGMKATLTDDRTRLLSVEKKLVSHFSFLPEEVWKNLGGDLPLLVLLCDKIPGNVAGFCIESGGYNCIALEIGGNESYYTGLFFHEISHAIDNRVIKAHPELISEWETLTPESVRAAVEKGTVDGKNALTVEFTKDDKNHEVCYVSPYAMKNSAEDRAETFGTFYGTVYTNKDTSLFSNEVLKKKAEHLGKMIRATFPLKDGTFLPFDSF